MSRKEDAERALKRAGQAKGQQKIKFGKARKLQQDEEVVLVNSMILYIYVLDGQLWVSCFFYKN